ncbi:MAG: glycerophosphodiester phosphodiesterase family protein, partial [Tumebacillaceae bacterium]
LSKTLKIGYLVADTTQFEKGLSEAKQQGNAILSCNYKMLLAHPELVQKANRAGIALAAWTVDSPDVVHRLEQLGIHKILTDKLIGL